MDTGLNTVVSHEKVIKDDHPEQGIDIPEEKCLVKSVASAVQVALTQLDRLWTDVGVASGERDVVCREILNAVESSLRGKINDARETKAQVTLKIRLALRRIKAIYTQLGVSPPNTDFVCADDAPPAEEEMTASCSRLTGSVIDLHSREHKLGLFSQLERLEGMLAAADAKRTEKLRAFTSKTEELRELLLEQYGVLDEERQVCLDLSGETDLSDAREQLLIKAIAAGRAARDARAKDIKEMVTSMRALWETLGTDDDDADTDRSRWCELDAEVLAGGAELKASTAVLKSSKDRLASLQTLEQSRREKVGALLAALQVLWARLQTPPEEQEAYQKEHSDVTMEEVQHHEAMLLSLEKAQSDMLPALITTQAARLDQLNLALLEQLHSSASAANASVSASHLSVEALEGVEAAVKEAEARLEKRLPVLALIERRDGILKEATELKNAGQDPSRLLDKSAGSFRARQTEEKRRNMVSKELPRVTDKLRKAIAEWEEEAGEPFIYLSRPYSELMEEQRMEEERELEGERQRREEERQRIKAKRSGVCAAPAPGAPGSSPCVGGMVSLSAATTPRGARGESAPSSKLESGSKQESAKQQALSNTPKCLGGKTPAPHERALSRPSVPPKSPAALLKAPGAGDRSAAAAAAASSSSSSSSSCSSRDSSSRDKENSDGNMHAQPAPSRRGLFTTLFTTPSTPAAKSERPEAARADGAAAAGSERGSELPAARQGAGVDLDDGTHTPLHSSNGAEKALSSSGIYADNDVGGDVGGDGSGGGSSSSSSSSSSNKSEAVQQLEMRLAMARQHLTPSKGCGSPEGYATHPHAAAEEVEDVESGVEGAVDASRTEEASPTPNSDPLPFARWIQSGCPIGTRSRTSGVCIQGLSVSTPLAAVREGSSEGSSECSTSLDPSQASSPLDNEKSAEAAADNSGGGGDSEERRLQQRDRSVGETEAEARSRGTPSLSSAQMVLDYLGDRYYTDEERVEIRRELLKEMEERKVELEGAVEKASKIRFKKGDVLGAGSFGQVFLGLNEATGELLAVKEVDCSRAGEAAIASLEAEIEMLQLLRHPNIVAYFGVQRHSGVSVLVEYCAGGSIASVIANFGALNEQVVRSYTRQILCGLDYLHKHCIVHRDVKCANVLLDSDGNVKVADFGASKNLAQINGEGHQMSMKGTPFFMAPEVVLQQDVGRQSDLWSVGCCVVEMGTSKPPFSGQFSNVAALLFHIARNVAPPVLPSTLSQECHDFCALCFRRNPKERPSARRLLRHPFVSNWSALNGAGGDDTRRSNLGRRQTRTSALF